MKGLGAVEKAGCFLEAGGKLVMKTCTQRPLDVLFPLQIKNVPRRLQYSNQVEGTHTVEP